MNALHTRASALQTAMARIARRVPWWATLAMAALSLVAGALLLLYPSGVTSRIAMLAGLGFLLSGLDDVASGIQPPPRLWGVAIGVLSAAAGLTVLLAPLPTIAMIWLAVAVMASNAIEHVVTAVRGESTTPRTDYAHAAIDVALIALCVISPGSGSVALAVALGIRSLVAGIRLAGFSIARARARRGA
ncbi:hypothetical protein [Microbacterium hydrocarbonoxydans]|uniref:hypothetical protein n=1 Tax=Microbacterium hydrocarbonoxydans TaxID=273678 RepID=UPI0007BC52BD|nr:hypothetical protein [Microbacterium hydrocarbonoxydans]GAT72443.1 hypothetical protein MHM582_0916 [Microbacterium sp. HM58-2]